MQDYGTQKAGSDDLSCQRRFKNVRGLDYHLQASHTLEGLSARLESETRMAHMLDETKIPYDRDWGNRIPHATTCKWMHPYFKGKSTRPDFRILSATNCILLVGNDEFAHRRYGCDLDRTLKITTALSSSQPEVVPIVYIRFNPHFYTRDGVYYDPALESRHEKLLDTIKRINSGEININPDGLSLIYLYYDTDADGRLCVFSEASEVNAHLVPPLEVCVISQ